MRELPIPDHMDIFHLTREIEASDMSSLEVVMNCDDERIKLEAEVECIAAHDAGGGEALDRIYERLDAMDATTAEKRAAEILNGLGFDKKMQEKKTRDFCGGWRMRIALARALFMSPTILLLHCLQVNQIGTVTEAIEVVKMAKDAEWGVVISQRSGETDDCFIADLAVDLATGQIKAGAPSRGSKVKEKQNQIQTIPCGARVEPS
ncbi:hypothetical protein L2E82_03150 [Cichorium intybus]|uniref:Uncharacterized protein n=1 Tax=Cichorium intybus TaxID=13427 RepID=A0ACB9H3I7_CICIN|nr:hypothetical protein L2E82_03150 [Cichorium intybus]